MSIEATAEALAPDTAMPVEAPEALEATEISEDSELDALFDSAQDEQPTEEPTEKAPEAEAVEDKHQAEPVKAPSDVPYAIKEHWGDIPETAQAAILESQREMGRKLAEQGRQMQGIAPIRDVLTKAVEDIPALANMRPDDAAAQIFELAKLSQDFSARPVETLMGYIQKHGLGEAMSAAMAGQPAHQVQQVPQLMKTIEGLERRIERLADPEHIRSSFDAFNSEAQVQSSVTEFASKAEHWDAVESHMPATVQYMQATLGEDASPSDVLSKAYDLAVSQFVPDAKAKQEVAAEEAAPKVDPERSKAALKAKSANVKSSSTGKFRTMTEDELLASTYDRAQI